MHPELCMRISLLTVIVETYNKITYGSACLMKDMDGSENIPGIIRRKSIDQI